MILDHFFSKYSFNTFQFILEGNVEGEEQPQQGENKKNQRLKIKKKKINRLAKALDLTYLQLKNCKKDKITKTCRAVIKQIYSSREQQAEGRISSMCPIKLRAIHCEYILLLVEKSLTRINCLLACMCVYILLKGSKNKLKIRRTFLYRA